MLVYQRLPSRSIFATGHGFHWFPMVSLFRIRLGVLHKWRSFLNNANPCQNISRRFLGHRKNSDLQTLCVIGTLRHQARIGKKKNGRAAPAFPSVHGGAGNTTRHSFGLRSFGRRYVNVASVLFCGLWCCFVTDRWQSSATQRNDCWWQVHILWCYTIGPPCARWLGLCNTCRRISLVPSWDASNEPIDMARKRCVTHHKWTESAENQ